MPFAKVYILRIAEKPVLNNLVFIAVKCRRDVTASAKKLIVGELSKWLELAYNIQELEMNRANKKPFNLYKTTCSSHFDKPCTRHKSGAIKYSFAPTASDKCTSNIDAFTSSHYANLLDEAVAQTNSSSTVNFVNSVIVAFSIAASSSTVNFVNSDIVALFTSIIAKICIFLVTFCEFIGRIKLKLKDLDKPIYLELFVGIGNLFIFAAKLSNLSGIDSISMRFFLIIVTIATISVKSDGDHKSRIRLSINVNSINLYTLVARIGFKRVLVKLSNLSGIDSISMRFFLIIVTIATISVNSDRNHRRTVTCRRCKITNYFISSLDELDHLWSSCRNLNDNSSTKPIVWPVIQLVPTMDQMLAGPGTK